jgi:hypothetical protein
LNILGLQSTTTSRCRGDLLVLSHSRPIHQK